MVVQCRSRITTEWHPGGTLGSHPTDPSRCVNYWKKLHQMTGRFLVQWRVKTCCGRCTKCIEVYEYLCMLTRGFSDFARLQGRWERGRNLKLADLVRPKSDMRKEWSTAQNLCRSWPYEIARKDKVVKNHPKILKDIHSMYGSGAC